MNELLRNITHGQFHFNHDVFSSVSPECKDLIRKLLVTNPDLRLTGQQAIHHPWFTKFTETATLLASPSATDVETQMFEDDVLKRLRVFKGVSTFKKAAMNLLVKTASEAEVTQLRAAFQ